ncbi:gliding motility-associated C-terminal domain-containing protein [uncultured Chitinophaga sp.]|uniref:gliding motility-associated C-terminal domain-containing protein n=1 Tax=uncultured Chitinophaga sp. TaxID=339340 RepID=UPI0025FE17C7|nr:gliding motility-associated C-terminal domain-containing protein [uncultured Chitinophaga sp.]
MLKYLSLCLLACMVAITAIGQVVPGAPGTACTNIGQNPSTAFPVCGTKVFGQNTVPACGGNQVFGASCGSIVLDDRFPYWYKFTCFEPGTLGFVITPNDITDDYDWQLWDVTGRNVNDVYVNNNKMFLACNWSGEGGATGTSSAGSNVNVCDGMGRPLFSAMPKLIKGHEYLLLISHFTPSQSGYQLEFKGGTASITDTLQPRLKQAAYNCGPYTVTLKLNKKMQCSTLAADGSDFYIASGAANIIGASSVCSGFDMDSVVLQLDRPLPAGTHSVVVKLGTDNNTILDICGSGLPVASAMNFVVLLPAPVPYDSIAPIGCSPNSIKVVFRDAIRCSSVAPNGSDFQLMGPAGVWITGVTTSCANGLTKEIILNLNAPVNIAAGFTLTLVRGTDNNTLLSECHIETPPGGVEAFNTLPPVNADFTYNVTLACSGNGVAFMHDGNNFTDTWHWFVDGQLANSVQNPSIIFAGGAPKHIELAVTNGLCFDTATADITFANHQVADFTMMRDLLCPEDFGMFFDKSQGNIISRRWEFGNGSTSNQLNPPPQMYRQRIMAEQRVPVLLITENDYTCLDTAIQYITLVSSCYTDVPTAFTPNGDGQNDFLYPLSGYKSKDLDFRVFNRAGNQVFHSTNWTHKWDGTINGRKADVGTYAWMLRYTNKETGQQYFLKGTSVLIR